jgi:hypothetical protein
MYILKLITLCSYGVDDGVEDNRMQHNNFIVRFFATTQLLFSISRMFYIQQQSCVCIVQSIKLCMHRMNSLYTALLLYTELSTNVEKKVHGCKKVYYKILQIVSWYFLHCCLFCRNTL